MSYFRGPGSAQWQDLYMHLYLSSSKLQSAYSHILSVLQDIENDAIENTANENIMERLNAAEKDIGSAKDFVQFSSLFLVKTQKNGSMDNRIESNILPSVENSDARIVTDTEPEIMDEVFEEYIMEEYLKPLKEEADEISLYNYKRDKTLFKNFMMELKDALVDKQKSMSEREAKALERMYKTLMRDTTMEHQQQRIPTPPPIPLLTQSSLIQNDNKTYNNATELQLNQLPAQAIIRKSLNKNENNFKEKEVDDVSVEEKEPIATLPLPRSKEFSSFIPPPFLKTEEEMFIGSGENSEEEDVEDTKAE